MDLHGVAYMSEYIERTYFKNSTGGVSSWSIEQFRILKSCKSLTLDVHQEESDVCYAADMSLLLEHGQYILHNETSPSFVIHYYDGSTKNFFFMFGRSCTIEELPCDDYMKLCLKLKYGIENHDNRFLYSYQ